MTKQETALFKHLPLGARFKYIGGTDVWVVLERHGCGKVAKWEGNILGFAGQAICSAEDSEAELESLLVEVVPDAKLYATTQRDQAITHLHTLLNSRRTATQAMESERAAREWLESIGSEAP